MPAVGHSLDNAAGAASELLRDLLDVLCCDLVDYGLEEPGLLVSAHYELVRQEMPHILGPDLLAMTYKAVNAQTIPIRDGFCICSVRRGPLIVKRRA